MLCSCMCHCTIEGYTGSVLPRANLTLMAMLPAGADVCMDNMLGGGAAAPPGVYVHLHTMLLYVADTMLNVQ